MAEVGCVAAREDSGASRALRTGEGNTAKYCATNPTTNSHARPPGRTATLGPRIAVDRQGESARTPSYLRFDRHGWNSRTTEQISQNGTAGQYPMEEHHAG